jgi:hypothetical protein
MFIKIGFLLEVKNNELRLKVALDSFKTITDAKHPRGLK